MLLAEKMALAGHDESVTANYTVSSMSGSTPPSAAFPDRLRTAREYRGLTQGELAERAGLQPSAVSHFETATRKPSFDNLLLLANTLDVTTDYLLGRVDDFKQIAGADKIHRHYHALEESDRRFADDLITRLAEKAAAKTQGEK